MDEHHSIRGVNLGGWLVFEHWITPSLFEGVQARDEFGWWMEARARKLEMLHHHRETFITRNDFAWIAEQGLNAVRIPVGHWVFGDVEPYMGAVSYLDFAMEAAEYEGLGVVIDLHTAPGSQNGWDHSGHGGEIGWPTQSHNIDFTLSVIERLAERYSEYPNLMGIELLNEPHWHIPREILMSYYHQGYQRVRKHCDDKVAVIISDAFRPNDWSDFVEEGHYRNMILDSHLYQCFSEEDRKLDVAGHIRKAAIEWSDLVHHVEQHVPLLVGEWSVEMGRPALEKLDREERDMALKAYGEAQLSVFEQASGWFYWTYKTEHSHTWDLRRAVKSGWLPRNFDRLKA